MLAPSDGGRVMMPRPVATEVELELIPEGPTAPAAARR